MFYTLNDLMVLHFAQSDYRLSDEADHSTDPDIKYIGYLNRKGEWYIVERNLANKTYRFCAGSAGYTTAWSGREALEYDYYDVVFG